MVVAPATANALAKMAAGIADDLLSTTLLAVAAPLVVAPAMNAAMWRHPATQANAALLRSRGVRFVGPGAGHLACGDDGVGRMAEPQQIVDALEALFAAPACGMPAPRRFPPPRTCRKGRLTARRASKKPESPPASPASACW